jgi:hypothetical protein
MRMVVVDMCDLESGASRPLSRRGAHSHHYDVHVRSLIIASRWRTQRASPHMYA